MTTEILVDFARMFLTVIGLWSVLSIIAITPFAVKNYINSSRMEKFKRKLYETEED